MRHLFDFGPAVSQVQPFADDRGFLPERGDWAGLFVYAHPPKRWASFVRAAVAAQRAAIAWLERRYGRRIRRLRVRVGPRLLAAAARNLLPDEPPPQPLGDAPFGLPAVWSAGRLVDGSHRILAAGAGARVPLLVVPAPLVDAAHPPGRTPAWLVRRWLRLAREARGG